MKFVLAITCLCVSLDFHLVIKKFEYEKQTKSDLTGKF